MYRINHFLVLICRNYFGFTLVRHHMTHAQSAQQYWPSTGIWSYGRLSIGIGNTILGQYWRGADNHCSFICRQDKLTAGIMHCASTGTSPYVDIKSYHLGMFVLHNKFCTCFLKQLLCQDQLAICHPPILSFKRFLQKKWNMQVIKDIWML